MKATQEHFITKEGLNDLKKELENLTTVVRPEVVADIKEARAQGDLSENAEYHAAREKQSIVEARIKELEYLIEHVTVIEAGDTSEVRVGSTVEIEYIDDLKEDIMRRDFTINTICMDKNKKIIDYLNARQDLANHLIKPVGDANYKFSQDVLRILRAIRFATKLDFSLSDEIIDGINKNKHLLKKISYERKREELDKIFTSPNAKRGIDLLIELGLDKELELNNLKNVTNTESLIGIWAIIDPEENTYRFTNNEKELIKSVKEVLPLNNLDPYNLYKYGLYVNSIAGAIKNIPKKDITRSYNNLVIHSRKDLAISIPEILNCLSIEKGPFIKTIYDELEKEVLYKRLKNNRKALLNYCVVNFTSEIL
jgi:tRNA nucleotidyltransferase (CCA-adding enzyme)